MASKDVLRIQVLGTYFSSSYVSFFLTHPDCTFAAEITITLYIIRYECRKKKG